MSTQTTRKSPRETQRAKRQRQQVLGRVAWSLIGLIGVVIVGYIVWGAFRPKPGQSVPQLPASHIQPGASHEPYNSDPPTSGPHYVEPAQGGFYNETPSDEQLVHNLEHGYVILWYNCSDLTSSQCDRLKSQIRGAMQAAGNSTLTSTPKLIAVPRPTLDTQLALTTWGRLDKFDAFDQNRIVNFIRAFRDHAPEPNAP